MRPAAKARPTIGSGDGAAARSDSHSESKLQSLEFVDQLTEPLAVGDAASAVSPTPMRIFMQPTYRGVVHTWGPWG